MTVLTFCVGRVAKVIKELRVMLSTTPPSTPTWLHIGEDTAPALLQVLDQWDPLPAARTAADILAVSCQSLNLTVAHHMLNNNSWALRELKEGAIAKLTTRAATLVSACTCIFCVHAIPSRTDYHLPARHPQWCDGRRFTTTSC